MIKIDSHNEKQVKYLEEVKVKIDNREFKRNLVVLGDVGVGKTYLVNSILQPKYFISESDFKMHLTSGNLRFRSPENWGCDVKGYPIEALQKFRITVYDDYGTSELSESYLDKMLYWLDKRKEKGYPTIFTSNLSLTQIQERDKRLASRILENADIVYFSGPDRRITGTTKFIKL